MSLNSGLGTIVICPEMVEKVWDSSSNEKGQKVEARRPYKWSYFTL